MKLNYSINKEQGNCHIVDSYKITKKGDMRVFISENLNEEPFTERSVESYVREWRAHNLLYELDFCRERTKDVDLNVDESIIKRIGYFILSMWYFGR